jgi:ribose 5-phosphate isomerase B
MKIALGMDHRGVDVARVLAERLPGEGHEVDVSGSYDGEPCDYPDVTWSVAQAVASGDADRGILICGTGIGASIAANKVPGVRAALVHDVATAELSRQHNDANVLCLAGDAMTDNTGMLGIVNAWLAMGFEGGRHARRVDKIAAIERGENPVVAVKA